MLAPQPTPELRFIERQKPVYVPDVSPFQTVYRTYPILQQKYLGPFIWSKPIWRDVPVSEPWGEG